MQIFAVTSYPLFARFGRNANAEIPCDRRSGCDSSLSRRAQDRTSGPQGRSCQRHRRFLGNAVIALFSSPDLSDYWHMPRRHCSAPALRVLEGNSLVAVYGSSAPWNRCPTWGFSNEVLTTSRGWTLIVLGNAIGCVFAVVVLSISVVSFPLLLDRDVGLAVAVRTSLRAVRENPITMTIWGLIIAAALAIGFLLLFAGLAVAVPILAHASWHLYRKVVDRATPVWPRAREARGRTVRAN